MDDINSYYSILVWLISGVLCFFLAGMWVLYLLKTVMNEDETAEKIRRHRRIVEEVIHTGEG